MQRRALIAGISAFVAVFVAGSVFVSLLRRAHGDSNGASPSVSAGPTATPSAVTGPSVDAYLVWVPGGLPPGFGAKVGALPTVGPITIVAADNIWMTSSDDKNGNVVDQPPSPYMIPIDGAAIDPRAYARFLPPETRAVVANLQDGQGILGQTSAKLRHLGPGGVMHFLGGGSVTIVGVLPDRLVGAAEIVVTRATGAAIGIRQNRYLLFQPASGLHPGDGQLEHRFRSLLPSGIQYPVVQVRTPGETPYLRMGDAVLPPALIKRRFGEWDGRPVPGGSGDIEIDPTWVAANIQTETVPVLGRVSCNRRLLPQLRKAMQDVVAQGLASTIHSYSGCYSARFVESQPTAGISHHAWGIAIDVNADTNRFGTPPDQDPRLVQLMARWGFTWGGAWIVPDGMHFEYIGRPAKRT
ncbi:MAG: M15 family metallopeptidase [Actinomycetota bacterium]